LATAKYVQFDKVCEALGLKYKKKKKGHVWAGRSPLNNQIVSVAVHHNNAGGDMATGTFNTEIKKLGFKNYDEFKDFLDKL